MLSASVLVLSVTWLTYPTYMHATGYPFRYLRKRGRTVQESITVQLLTDDDKRCKPSVICLAAKRGAGTVYNDQRVCDAFDLRLWLCMPEKFDAKGIMVSIIEHATQVQCDIRELKFLRASCSR